MDGTGTLFRRRYTDNWPRWWITWFITKLRTTAILGMVIRVLSPFFRDQFFMKVSSLAPAIAVRASRLHSCRRRLAIRRSMRLERA